MITGASGICRSCECCDSCGRRGVLDGVEGVEGRCLFGVLTPERTLDKAVACSCAVFVSLRATDESWRNGVLGEPLSVSLSLGIGGGGGVLDEDEASGLLSNSDVSFKGVGGGGCEST